MKQTMLIRILLAAALAFALTAHAEDYPNKPIKIIVPFTPGGGTDRIARIVAERLQKKWSQSVIVENRGGAGGNIGAEVVWRSAPDGYTLLVSSPGPLALNKALYPKLSYDSDAFVPISLMATTPFVLVVPQKAAIDSLQKLFTFAKANPNQLNYASSGGGTSSHLAGELFKSMAGIKMVHVPYKGTSPAVTDLIGGPADMLFVEFGTALQFVLAGKLRALAIGSEKRNPLLLNVPAVSEALPGFLAVTWHGMVAPPKTPPAIANAISAAVAEILKEPDVAKRLLESSVEPVGSTPAEMTEFLKQERGRWGRVIQAAGTTME